ncbi:hypothetical protein JKP88DRAFT_178516, partial [Tribonema minus]
MAVLQQQQQGLLLMWHVSNCSSEEGKCQVTQHCAKLKTLWQHIVQCKVQMCTVPHCVSLRSVLSHYQCCEDHECALCVPVR